MSRLFLKETNVKTRYIYLLLIFLSAALLPSISSAAELKSALELKEGTYQLTVTGNDFPGIKHLSLTFNYQSDLVNPAEVIVSSPLAKTAFSAMLDTADKKLVLNIVATSVVTMNNGDAVTIIKGISSGGDGNIKPFQLSDAFYVDESDNQIKPEIEDMAIRGGYRALTAISDFHRIPADKSIYALNGACKTGRLHISSGLLFTSDGHRIALLSHAGTRSRVQR